MSPLILPRRNKTFLDLFCGAGGFSLGAELAGLAHAGAVDCDDILTSSFIHNFPLCNLLIADLTKVSISELRTKFGLVRRPDFIIGGPPCQGFSAIGKRISEDPRNQLVYHFMRIVSALQPACFVMENVPGILLPAGREVLDAALNQLPGRFSVLPPLIVNAAAFGAATLRERTLVIGYDPEEMDRIDAAVVLRSGKAKATTVREAISDLPEAVTTVGPMGENYAAPYRSSPFRGPEGKYARAARRQPPAHLGSDLSRRLLCAGKVTAVGATFHTAEVTKRFATIRPGQRDEVSKGSRLSWDGQCTTIRAGTGTEHGSFQAVRPIHPEAPRVITVREAARLQGFPDWFQLHATKWHSFRMIGNSVCPIVARKIMSYLAKQVNETWEEEDAA